MKIYVLAMTCVGSPRMVDHKYPIADQWGRGVDATVYLTPSGTGTEDYRLAATFDAAAEAEAESIRRGWSRQYVVTTPPSRAFKGFFSASPSGLWRVWDRHLDIVLSRHDTREQAMAAIAALPVVG